MTGIDVFGTGLMNTIDQVTFVIALKAGKLSPGHFHLSSGGRNDIHQSRFSINVRFACAKQIQIRAVAAEVCFLPWLVKIAFLIGFSAFCRQMS